MSSWDLDDHMLAALGLSPSGIERIVESGQDLGVAASVDIWANGEHHRANGGIAVRDDGALARAADRDVRERGDVRASWAHLYLLMRRGCRQRSRACVLEGSDAGQAKVRLG